MLYIPRYILIHKEFEFEILSPHKVPAIQTVDIISASTPSMPIHAWHSLSLDHALSLWSYFDMQFGY